MVEKQLLPKGFEIKQINIPEDSKYEINNYIQEDKYYLIYIPTYKEWILSKPGKSYLGWYFNKGWGVVMLRNVDIIYELNMPEVVC